MNGNLVFALALGVGIVAGLRAMTAPAVVSWAARLAWLDLHGTPLGFMRSTVAAVVFSLGAIFEYVNDKLPKTPSRTALPSLVARIVTGGLSGACLCVPGGESGGQSLIVGAVLGAIGAFGGYQARTRLVRSLKVKDIFVAIPEDLVAIGLALFFVSRR